MDNKKKKRNLVSDLNLIKQNHQERQLNNMLANHLLLQEPTPRIISLEHGKKAGLDIIDAHAPLPIGAKRYSYKYRKVKGKVLVEASLTVCYDIKHPNISL